MISPIDEIKSRLDIVDVISSYIRLQKAGRNFKANCPFHSEKTPSFFVSPERQMWYCFGCQMGGSMFDFVMQMEGVEFGDALRILARRAGVELKKIDPKIRTKRSRLYDICELATRFYEKQLQASQAGQSALKYLKNRGLTVKTLSDWRIGYAPESWRSLKDFLQSRGYVESEILNTGLLAQSQQNADQSYDRFRKRIIFPIFDLSGLAVGFTGRVFGEGEPKYLNTPNTLLYDKSVILYGLDKAKLQIKKQNQCLLVEGQMDVLAAHQNGVQNAVAVSGTALTPQHLNIIKRYTDTLVFSFDMDSAGQSATLKALDLAIAADLNTQIVSLPQGKDPADLLTENQNKFLKLISQAQSVIDYCISAALAKYDVGKIEGKKLIAKEVLPRIKQISNQIEKAHWLDQLALTLKTDIAALESEMNKIVLRPLYQELNSDQSKENLHQQDKAFPLEQFVISMVLTHPECIEKIKNEPSHYFKNKDLEYLFKKIKDHSQKKILKISDFKKALPEKYSAYLDFLMLKAETQIPENTDVGQEIEFGLAQLKKNYLQLKLTQLNTAIKIAEHDNDADKLTNLTAKFNRLSQKIISS